MTRGRYLYCTLDPAGHDLSAEWDSLGRQTRLSMGNEVLEEYRYDIAAQQALGRIAEVRYRGGRQLFTYNPAGRLIKRDYFYEAETDTHSLRYEYDSLGRETAVIHTDGTRIDRHLTFNGWTQAIPGIIQSIDYEPRGFPSTIHYQNGVRTEFDYTPGPGRILHQSTTLPADGIIEQVEFNFDKMDILLSSNDTAPSGPGLREFAYDPLYQITAVSNIENGNIVQRRYDYASDYNLRRFEETHTTLHYDDTLRPDRLSGLTPNDGALFTINYDGNGNLLKLPGQQFEYNPKNELKRFTRDDGLVADYHYDHLGFRISKTVTDTHGGRTRILYISDQAEIRNGTPAYFVSVGLLRVAVLTGDTIRFLHENGIGSTSFVTDMAGKRIGAIDYRPFGNAASSSGDIQFRRFSLSPEDPETGLVYMHRRYYAPQLGRFLTPDLMAIYQPEKFLHAPQGLHLYTFVANNPLNKTDPTGMSFWSIVGAVAGVIVGVAVGLAIVAAVVATGGVGGIFLGIGLALLAGLAFTGVSYLAANNSNPNSDRYQFFRSFMIGFNAGMNGVLASTIVGGYVGFGVGVVLGLINLLAVHDGIAKNSVYQGILGWSSWLMPMSWGATGFGLAVYAINIVVAMVTNQNFEATTIDKMAIDWKTGSIVMVGGAIRNGAGFNMGNFVFIDPGFINAGIPGISYESVLRHETGHTLSVAAFGSVFHLSDFIDEVVLHNGANAYGEKIAESHSNIPGRPVIPMWG